MYIYILLLWHYSDPPKRIWYILLVLNQNKCLSMVAVLTYKFRALHGPVPSAYLKPVICCTHLSLSFPDFIFPSLLF
jgi:hypothetical protein